MSILVFYDGTCPFCVYSARKLKKLDWFDKLSLINLHSPGELEKFKIPYDEAMNRIQVVRGEDNRKEGMEAIMVISFYLPLLWVFIPLFWIAIKLGLGSMIYDWIAKNRFLFPVPGYCPLPDADQKNKN